MVWNAKWKREKLNYGITHAQSSSKSAWNIKKIHKLITFMHLKKQNKEKVDGNHANLDLDEVETHGTNFWQLNQMITNATQLNCFAEYTKYNRSNFKWSGLTFAVYHNFPHVATITVDICKNVLQTFYSYWLILNDPVCFCPVGCMDVWINEGAESCCG